MIEMLDDERKATGSHFTPTELAQFVARMIAATSTHEKPLVIDPACGDGELLWAFSKEREQSTLVGLDLDATALQLAASRLEGRFENKDFLELVLSHRGEDLFHVPEKFDVAIANPPYVRTQVLGADRAQKLAEQFNLSGRVDIYFAFLEGIATVLKPGGIAGIIVSNRFMTTRAGEGVRERILENFDVLNIWDMGDTKLFAAAVLPAVLLLRRKDGSPAPVAKMSTIYTAKGRTVNEATSPLTALESTGLVRVGKTTFEVKHGTLNVSQGSWRIATVSGDKWLDTVLSHTTAVFRDIGKIRVGVKTTADKVFVKDRWPTPRPEVLRPLISKDAERRYRSLPANQEILYTHEMRNGKRVAIQLDEHPITRKYLESHRETLTSRTYVIEGNRQWFEIWVPHQPDMWARPKLVFPDISEKPVFWMSQENEVVQGNCYWLTADNDSKDDLLWLALAVGNSRFIEEFYDHSFNNKLYAGRRRFMTQYVEKFPLPDPTTPLAKEIIKTTKEIFAATPSDTATKKADSLESKIYQVFGLKKSAG